MGKSYHDILRQIEALKKEAARLHDAEVKGVVTRIREAIATYGLTASDLGFAVKKAATPTAPSKRSKSSVKVRPAQKIAPKYRDEAGNTWTGRGLKPRWLTAALAAGRKIEEFAI